MLDLAPRPVVGREDVLSPTSAGLVLDASVAVIGAAVVVGVVVAHVTLGDAVGGS